MVQQMDKIRLVYEHWFHDGQIRRPFLNGVHPAVYDYIRRWYGDDIHNIEGVKNHIKSFNESHHWSSLFTHENLFSYYKKFYGLETCITPNEIIDDNKIYLWPLEVGGVLGHFHKEQCTLSLEGQVYNYTFWDTITPIIMEYLRSGRVKMLINMVHDPLSYQSDLIEIERCARDHGIDPANIVIIAGNKLDSYSNTFPVHRKIKITSGIIMVQQAGDKLNPSSYPSITGLGYESDLVRPMDLNRSIIRPKKFISFNRQMRKHRYLLMYLALKHNLIDEGYFSFLNNHCEESVILQLLRFYNVDNDGLEDFVKKMLTMFPYELDTAHIPKEQKGGFATNNYKKELYMNSYLHIVSETRFDEGDPNHPFFSEKSFHGIVNLQPFIYIGNNKGLERLREWGIKTFHPFIDESYDLQTIPTLKARMIEQNLLKFHNMTLNEIHDWYYSITDILIHNQEAVKEFSKIDPFKEAFEDIVKWYT